MDLLDLSPEIFELIIEELVLDVGFAAAWKEYRGVCRPFACVIRRFIFNGKHHLDMFPKGKRGNLIQATVENKEMFLYQRLESGFGVHISVRSRIVNMANWLVREMGEDKKSDLDDCQKRLCFGTAMVTEPHHPESWKDLFLDMMTYGHPIPYSLPNCLPTLEEQFEAAVVMNCRELLEKTLRRFSGFSGSGTGLPHTVGFTDSVLLGAALGHSAMFDLIFQYANSIPGPTPDEWASWLRFIGRKLSDAVRYSIWYRQYDILRRIVWVLQGYFQDHDAKEYLRAVRMFIENAAYREAANILNVILDLNPTGSIYLDETTFSNICNLGDVPIMSKLLKKRICWAVDDPEYTLRHPVDTAIAQGNPQMLTVVLEAVSEYETIGRNSRYTAQPFLAAIDSMNLYAIKTLLARAKTVHNVDLPYQSILQQAAVRKDETIYSMIRDHAATMGKQATSYVSAARTGEVVVYEVKENKVGLHINPTMGK